MIHIENLHTEYVQKVTPELEKEVVAFLNSNKGGIIYIGVDKNGVPTGLKHIEKGLLLIKDRLVDNVLPSCLGLFDVLIEEIDGNKIIKLIVAGGYEKPYYIKKHGLSEQGVFIRIGNISEPLSNHQIDRLSFRRNRKSIVNMKSPKLGLRFEQLHSYYNAAGKTLSDQFAHDLSLKDEDGDFNQVAYLLNDVNNISIQVARYNGVNRYNLIENNEYGYVSLIQATYQVLEKLNLENKAIIQTSAKARKEQDLWDPIALRAAVINAVLFNDYTRDAPPKIEIFNDRIEVASCGGLPQGLSKEEFLHGFPVVRNKELLRVFKDLKLIEQFESRIPRILKTYGKECFCFFDNFLRVVLPSKKEVQDEKYRL